MRMTVRQTSGAGYDFPETDTDWKRDVEDRLLTDTDALCSAQSMAELQTVDGDRLHVQWRRPPKTHQVSQCNARFLPGQRWWTDTGPPGTPRCKPCSPTLTMDSVRSRHLSHIIVHLLATFRMHLSLLTAHMHGRNESVN